MRIARAAVDILRLAFARDHLGTDPVPTPAPERKAPGVLHVLFVSREPLGLEPEPPRAPRSLFRAVFAREVLPLDPEPAASRPKGRLAALLAPEKLDVDDAQDDVP